MTVEAKSKRLHPNQFRAMPLESVEHHAGEGNTYAIKELIKRYSRTNLA